MLRNVHIGVDGSPTGREAIALAIALAEPDAHMTLAHVHGGEISAGGVLNRAFGADGPEDAQRITRFPSAKKRVSSPFGGEETRSPPCAKCELFVAGAAHAAACANRSSAR